MSLSKLTNRLILSLMTLCLSLVNLCNAEYLNIGNLDVKGINEQGKITSNLNLDLIRGKTSTVTLLISNFSPETKELSLYATDTIENNNLQVPIEENRPDYDIGSWITLPTKHLSLASGQSLELKININTPGNAGVGQHFGAIMVKEDIADEDLRMVNQQGIKIIGTLPGEIDERLEVISKQANIDNGNVIFETKLRNSGNNDLNKFLNLTVVDPISGEKITKTEQIFLPNKTQKTYKFFVQSTSSFLTIPQISIDSQTSILGVKLNQPENAFILILFLFGTILIVLNAKSIHRKRLLRITATGLTAIALTFSFTSLIKTTDLNLVQGNLIETKTLDSYITVIKWGNIKKEPLPQNYKQNWNGNITFKNAKVTIQEYLHFEPNDSVTVTNEDSTQGDSVLNYKLSTGPDNDGLILKIEPTSSEQPQLIYEEGDREVKVLINNTLSNPTYIKNKQHSIQIVSAAGPERLRPSADTSPDGLIDLEATPELIAGSNEEILKLFTDLPATPEELAKFILESDYVKIVTTSDNTSNVTSSPELITALEATPELLKQISATPELNFVFIPDSKIKLPSQEFSFRTKKIASQELGTFIFVQNKNAPWNSFIKVSDFVSVDGRGVIPASNISIDPGEPILLTAPNETDITGSDSERLENSSYQKLLFSVNPKSEEEAVFILKPRITIEIPAGTIPGRYQAQITMTSL